MFNQCKPAEAVEPFVGDTFRRQSCGWGWQAGVHFETPEICHCLIAMPTVTADSRADQRCGTSGSSFAPPVEAETVAGHWAIIRSTAAASSATPAGTTIRTKTSLVQRNAEWTNGPRCTSWRLRVSVVAYLPYDDTKTLKARICSEIRLPGFSALVRPGSCRGR
jgi:hypothetical protein